MIRGYKLNSKFYADLIEFSRILLLGATETISVPSRTFFAHDEFCRELIVPMLKVFNNIIIINTLEENGN